MLRRPGGIEAAYGDHEKGQHALGRREKRLEVHGWRFLDGGERFELVRTAVSGKIAYIIGLVTRSLCLSLSGLVVKSIFLKFM